MLVIAQVPEIRVAQTTPLSASGSPAPGVPRPQTPAPDSEVRKYLLSRGDSAFADRGFQGLMVLCAVSIFGIVALIATELFKSSHLAWTSFGWRFFFTADIDPSTHLPWYWDPVNGHFSALPFVYGTLV